MTRAQKILIELQQGFAELMKHYPFTMETLAGEEWRDIEGTDGKYQISNYGRVKSFKYHLPRILKLRLDKHGYLICQLNLQNKHKPVDIHRLVANAFIPNPDNKPQVNHVDGIKWNSVLTNLEWSTSSENSQHAYDTGLNAPSQGEDNVHAKLTNEQVLYIRENVDGVNATRLGEIFGVSRSTIQNVQLGLCYKTAGGKLRNVARTPKKVLPNEREEIYRLYQSGNYSQRQLGEMYGIAQTTVRNIIKSFDKQKGISVNYRYKCRVTNDICKQICTEYVKDTTEFGSTALAKKYNLTKTIIWRILHEGLSDYKPREKRPRIPDDIREQIRTEYVKGSKEFGTYALARKYGVGKSSILRIINEK